MRWLILISAVIGCENGHECLLDTSCVADYDCPSGSRCNTARANPVCTKIHCGPQGFACPNEDVCNTGLQCYKSACTRCDICGSECEVDFNWDSNHCGSCDVKAGPHQLCENGQLVASCGDTTSSPTDCGACGNACEIRDSYYAQCIHSVCEHWSVNYMPLSCDEVCAGDGLVCSPTGQRYAYYSSPNYNGTPKVDLATCQTVPEPYHDEVYHFDEMVCACLPP
jgi:hypothetical protein